MDGNGDVGTYPSMDDPPCVPMFQVTNKPARQTVASAVTEIGSATATAISGGQPGQVETNACSGTSGAQVSPGKRVDLRGKSLQQLRDLHGLLELGVITQKDFDQQKGIIMEELNKLA